VECKGEHKRVSQLILKLVIGPAHKRWKGLLRNPNLANIGPRWRLMPTKWLRQWLSTIFKIMYENKNGKFYIYLRSKFVIGTSYMMYYEMLNSNEESFL
jgi:hypothetical protein